MPLGTIDTVKEYVQGYQPLLLVEIILANGSPLYLSTHNVTWGGNAYLPRIIDLKLGAIQAQSDQGISVPSTASIKCADADGWLYANFEAPNAITGLGGIKGAQMTLVFVYYDIVSGEFSSDSIVKFTGRCGSPQIDDKSITIPALNFYNLAPYQLPALQIQALCPWIFPATAALQYAAANGTNQNSKECPYNPSVAGNERGNLNGSVIYTSCGKSKADCQARGMYTLDSSSRKTGCYGGVQFNPPTSEVSRSYETSKWQQVLNNGPEAQYGDVVTLMYGEGWASCKVLNTWPDANYMRMEVLVTYGKVGDIFMVLVNNVEIPHVFGDPIGTTPAGVTTTAQALKIGWWQFVNDGSTYSAPGSAYGGQGDPYGSLCVLYIQCVVDIAAAGSVPNVQVLLQGQQVRVYSSATNADDPSTYTNEFSSNPWWINMDLLTWANLEYDQLDIAGFLTEAAYADSLIDYTSQYGSSGTHARFAFTLCLTQANTADQTLRSTLLGLRGCLIPNAVGGLLSPHTNKTLADQQPAAVDGSNYNTAVPSFNSAGSSANGYLAYYFAEGTIAEDDQGNTTLNISQAAIQQAPNRLGFVFQDAENTFNQDTVQLTDDEDIAISGQVVTANMPVNGPNTYDHGQRIIATRLAEGYRGNMRLALDGETVGDTRGTMTISFQTSHRVVKLNMGQIVAVESVKYGWSLASYLSSDTPPPFFRIQSIEPDANYERVKITATYHNDGWYVDTWGQTNAPLWTSGWRSPNLQGARPLTLLGIAPVTYSTVGGATHASLTMLIAPPVNTPNGTLQPPYVPLQALSANTGGALAGGQTYYIALVALSASGPTAPSLLSRVFVAAGTSTNTIELTGLYWDANTTGYVVYAGITPDQLFIQTGNYAGSGGTTAQPASITITGALTQSGAFPDNKFSFVRFKSKFMYLPGVWTGALSSATFASSTWTLGLEVGAGPAFATNALVGRAIALIGRATSIEADIYPLTLPVAYPTALTITASTANSITVTGDATGVVAFAAGDQITIRLGTTGPNYNGVAVANTLTIGSDGGGNFIEDALLVNPNSTLGLSSTSISAGDSLLRIISGTGEGLTVYTKSNTATKIYILGNWPVTPDATSVFVVEDSGWDTSFDTSVIYNDGSVGVLSFPFDVSAYTGQTVLVMAIAVGADGTESSEIAAPVREAYLLAQGAAIDSLPPPLFGLSITTDYRGNFIISNVGPILTGAETASSYNTVEHATVQLFTWDMSKAVADWVLASPMASTDTTLTVVDDSAAVPYVGQLLVLNQEIVVVEAVSGATFSVVRASMASMAAGHPIGTGIFALDSSAIQLSFAPLFFTSINAAAASIYQQKVQSPDTILIGAEFYATNDLGNGPVNHYCFAAVTPSGYAYGVPEIPDGGLIAGVGGIADTFGVQGTLAIGSNLATPYQRDTITLPRQMVAQVRLPPIGNPITIQVLAGGSLYQTIVIPASAIIQIVEGPLPPLPANAVLTLNIIGVGSTFPGSDLGLTIYG